MALKKSELYSSLWASCDELRGGMDASQYKDYVLTLLFVKYVSDKYAGNPRALISIPKGGSFADMVKLKGDKEIGDKVNKIIGRLAEENDLKGVIDIADFNDEDKLGKGKDMVEKLSNLIAIFDDLDLRTNRAEGDDLLGDAYEYLMRNFATESGKAKGQFYTPAEVSRVLAKVLGIGKETRPDHSVYDPTCGSGSLLLKVADEAPRGLSIYGQEMDNATASLARMNMFLHDAPTAVIWKDNTLAHPHFKGKQGGLETFDFVVANPPFSTKAWSNGFDPEHDEFDRFEGFGIPPEKNGDYAFLLHIIKSLKSSGKAAVILPHGVLFRGHAEAAIRKNIIKRGLIKGIIGLPANLFYGTGIPACIIVIDKENAHARTGIFMIDASKGFEKDGNKNRLRSRDIHKIVDVFTKQTELPRYSRMVSHHKIAENDYNLNIPRYIDSSEPEDRHDLDAHLNGGIPNSDIDALDDYWHVFPSLRHALFKRGDRKGYSNPRVAAHEVKQTILEHEEFVAFDRRVRGLLTRWQNKERPTLEGIKVGSHPKQLIHELAESLLQRFTETELLDEYAVYQHLMSYWDETMQDDLYQIVEEGWKKAAQLRLIVEEKGQKNKESPDLVINKMKYKADLIPPALIIARYFVEEQRVLEVLQADSETVAQELEAFVEEHSGEEGLLEEAKSEKGKVTMASLKARIAALKGMSEAKEELAVLKKCQQLLEREATVDKAVKEAQRELDEKLLAKYPKLTEAEIKTLVVDDKWLATIAADVQAVLERITQQLAGRVKALEERYAEPLPVIAQSVESLSDKVAGHLKSMGFQL